MDRCKDTTAQRIFSIIILMLGMVCISPSISHAKYNPPIKDMCEFSTLLTNKGGDEALDKLVEMFSWNEAVAEKVKSAASIIASHEYTDSLAYLIASFGGVYKEYFVVASTKESGAAFFHFRFEVYNGELRIVNFSLNESYKSAIDEHGAFAQTPSMISC